MSYRIDATRTLIFGGDVCAVFDACRTKTKTEAGGILLGRVYPTTVAVEIASTPSSADRAGPFFFERSTRVSQNLVNNAWSASGGEQIYVGEWHSHPAAVAVPSDRDRTMILNNLREAKMEIDFLILVVVGRHEDWVGLRTKSELRRLPPIANCK